MKFKKRTLIVLLAVLVLGALALVGCTSSNSTDNTSSSTGTNSTTSSSTDSSSTATNDTSNPLNLVTPGKLTIGSDCDYPPFISLDNGQPAGFEYDLMSAIADDMGLQLNYLAPQNFDTLVASVSAGGKMDLAVSSLTITDEREQQVNFCIPYFDSNQAVVTLKTSPYTKASDLDGKVIGAQSGTTGESWAIENLPNATMKNFNQTSEGLAALQAGSIEAMIFDQPVADWQVQNTYTNCQIIEVIPTGEQYGFAVSKDNPALEDAVNASLQKLIDNGTFAQIFSKYFSYAPSID
ncbi:MAG: ABC transporter substrate-binding protein [Coriobacteriia bacterium]|nr:ABC transporter substrate-binding protein [Coriobacteriia bacterium]